jgi:hypothetical protein
MDEPRARDHTVTRTGRAADCAICARPLAALLLVLWLLNILDWMLTRHALARGVAEEANHIMDFFIQAGPTTAVVFKVGVVSAGVLCLWLLRRYRATLVATALVTVFYACVVVYQLVWLFHLATA